MPSAREAPRSLNTLDAGGWETFISFLQAIPALDSGFGGCAAPDAHAREKLFIHYSGNRLGIVDRHTGEIREAELFVATLGASMPKSLGPGSLRNGSARM